MAEPKKDHSVQARFGFADEDLKTSLHDEIIMWCHRYAAEIYTLVLRKNALAKVEIPKWECWLKNNQGYLVGAVDLAIRQILKDDDVSRRSLFIEAKGTIRTFGELMRQLNLYRGTNLAEWGRTDWLVVSPDDRFAALLEEQGIHFLKYDAKRTFVEVGR